MHRPQGIDDLAPAAYNPRTITDEAASGLRASLGDFGDISGITFNGRTGQLVSGHQRVKQLKALGGRLAHDGGLHIEIPDTGETYPVRVVDWDAAKERRANIVANNPHIGGAFTADLQGLLEQVQFDIGDVAFERLRLNELSQAVDEATLPSIEDEDDPGVQQMTFILTDSQAEIVKAAVKAAAPRLIGDGNKNGEALAIICGEFI